MLDKVYDSVIGSGNLRPSEQGGLSLVYTKVAHFVWFSNRRKGSNRDGIYVGSYLQACNTQPIQDTGFKEWIDESSAHITCI